MKEEVNDKPHHKTCVDIVNSFSNNELKQFMLALQDQAKQDDDPFALIERCNAVALRSMIFYQWSMIGGENKESFKHYAYDFVGRFFRVIEMLGEPELLNNEEKK